MCYFLLRQYKMAVRFEDVLFWILIAAVVSITLWLLSGSPPETNWLISIILFVAVSELLIWRYYFRLNKKTSVGFMKVKYDLEDLRKDLSNRLDNIENLIKNKK